MRSRRMYRRPRAIVRRPRTTVRRQAFGNFASALQQRDSTNVVISSVEDVSILVPQGVKEATLDRNVNSIMTTTQYFANYMGMYDQYKLNAVRVSVEMTYIGNELLNNATFPKICTAWDRNGVKINSVLTEAPNTYHYQLPTYEQVASYSSANEKTLYYGSRWGVIRQLDAASMMEKSIYLPTTSTKDVLTVGNMYAAWNPQLMLAIRTSADVNNDQTVSFTLHWQFDITLRGLRKVPSISIQPFMPNAGFIGYAKNNKGYAIQKDNTDGTHPTDFVVAGTITQGQTPTINPALSADGQQTGIVVPNNGYAENNINI